jgi:nickel-dependent lactate racemase
LGGWPRLEAAGLDPHPAASEALERALDAAWPAAAGGSSGGSRAGKRLALVVPDRTRPLPLARLLPPLLQSLARQGAPPARTTLVPASGIHAPMTSGELERLVGTAAARSGARLSPHDADAEAVALGTTSCGLSVRAHPSVAEADAVLVVGRVVFHYLAGFGGGRKLLVPGVSARRTVLATHARCLAPSPARGRHPRAAPGVLAGNPVHEAACAGAALFPAAGGLHITLARDGRVAEIEGGDLVRAHEAACERYRAAHVVRRDRPVAAALVSAGGAPMDRNLVQAHKALDAIAPVVRDGGLVVLVARCADGIGNPEVEEGLRLGDTAAIDAQLRRRFRVGIHTALALREKTERLDVRMVTDLPDEIVELAGMRRAASLDALLAELRERGSAGDGVLAPHGASLLYALA